VSHLPIRPEIRLQLLRASDRIRQAGDEVARAIEAFDRGDFWDKDATDAKISVEIASDQIQTAKGMSLVASMPERTIR